MQIAAAASILGVNPFANDAAVSSAARAKAARDTSTASLISYKARNVEMARSVLLADATSSAEAAEQAAEAASGNPLVYMDDGIDQRVGSWIDVAA